MVIFIIIYISFELIDYFSKVCFNRLLISFAKIIVAEKTISCWFFHFRIWHCGLFCCTLKFPPLYFQLQSSLLLWNLIFYRLFYFIKLNLILCYNFFNIVTCKGRCLTNVIVIHFLVFMFYLHYLYFIVLIDFNSICRSGSWIFCLLRYRTLCIAHRFNYFRRSHDCVHFSLKIHILITAYGLEIFHTLWI